MIAFKLELFESILRQYNNFALIRAVLSANIMSFLSTDKQPKIKV